MKLRKSHVGDAVTFSGLLGDSPSPATEFPSPATDILLSISPHEEQKTKRPNTTLEIASTGPIPHKDLEKLVGKLSLSRRHQLLDIRAYAF